MSSPGAAATAKTLAEPPSRVWKSRFLGLCLKAFLPTPRMWAGLNMTPISLVAPHLQSRHVLSQGSGLGAGLLDGFGVSLTWRAFASLPTASPKGSHWYLLPRQLRYQSRNGVQDFVFIVRHHNQVDFRSQ